MDLHHKLSLWRIAVMGAVRKEMTDSLNYFLQGFILRNLICRLAIFSFVER